MANKRINLLIHSIVIVTFQLYLLMNPIWIKAQSTTSKTTTIVTTPPTREPTIQYTNKSLEEFKLKAICFQKRFRTNEQLKNDYKLCGELIENFCDNVYCEEIKSCPPNYILVPKAVGHVGCCSACIRMRQLGERCDPNNQALDICENGLECSPSKGFCDIPQTPKECLREMSNRLWLRKKIQQNSGFWIPAEMGSMTLLLEYDRNMSLPSCSPKSGKYAIKQRLINKAFCVDPENGKPTFGVVPFSKAQNQTCKCSSAIFNKLNRLPTMDITDYQAKLKALTDLEEKITKHYAETHVKCTSDGDYHQMQCVNETCLCVNENTGIPMTTVREWENYQEQLDAINKRNNPDEDDDDDDDNDSKDKNNDNNEDDENNENILTEEEKAKKRKKKEEKLKEEKEKRELRINAGAINSSATVIFGAFRPLLCFDEKRAKEVKSNFSKDVYIETCQKEIETSMTMQVHFAQKGTRIKKLESKTCGYDDRFARKQCLPDVCRCSNPHGMSIGSYSVEFGKRETMDCGCALEEYYGKEERQDFDGLHCDGDGNFSPLQCPTDLTCYCADTNGAPISKEFSLECVEQFLKKYAAGYELRIICNAMRATVRNDLVWPEDEELWYNKDMKTYINNKIRPPKNSIENKC
ncbi:hypothetical protein RDWZM_006371 [Blomia tropicalis]|uniref:Thyroglobulin type-1 domain-containing protein n=1 Tax=Blomia tropicalis TaxID=40697 RepID=A0A9Q0M7Y9_BLOTA|nr:hypothetical protein RDWZM_006371 [Blomia tropicalis]